MFGKMLRILSWTLGAVFALVLGVVLIGFTVLWFFSPGEAQPILGADGAEVPGSISTIERVMLGGVEQALIIRGVDASAPVMLFLHGGPGSPEFPMLRQTNPGLEDDFVMVYWQQRGAGMSFAAGKASPEAMNLDQFIADTAALASLLADRFGKDRVFLMGHSWGTLLGLSTVKAHPELFHAYFGVGNVAYQYEGERLSLEWVRMRAAETGNAEAMEALAGLALPAPDAGAKAWLSYIKVQRRWLDQLGGGTAHDSFSFATLGKWMAMAPEYRLRDKLNFFRGVLFSVENLWQDVVTANLIETTARVGVPVYFLQGAWDYQTPTPLARRLFEAIEAPTKEYVEFADSAHSPIMEEPEKFNAFVRAAAYGSQ